MSGRGVRHEPEPISARHLAVRVVATVVVAQRLSGEHTYVYRNSLLPADTLPSQIEHLLGMGAISEIGKVAQ